MNKRIYYSILIVILAILVVSCEKEAYIIGGEINETNKVNMTTFDFLKSLDETKNTAILFERAGLKDVVNGDVTIVAPGQWAINRYLQRKNNQAWRVNPNTPELTMDDISSTELEQMKMYILPDKLWSQTIPEGGLYVTALDGTEVLIDCKETYIDPGCAWDGGGGPGRGYQYSNFLEQIPRIVHVHYKRGNNWELTGEQRTSLGYDNPECDQMYRMYLSDVITTTGVVHILYQGDYNYTEHYYYHSLFFFGVRTDDRL